MTLDSTQNLLSLLLSQNLILLSSPTQENTGKSGFSDGNDRAMTAQKLAPVIRLSPAIPTFLLLKMTDDRRNTYYAHVKGKRDIKAPDTYTGKIIQNTCHLSPFGHFGHCLGGEI